MSELYAITIRLPWAAAIRDGVKLVENRGRPIPEKYIGQRVAIHAGSAWDGHANIDSRVLGWWWPDRSVEMPSWRALNPLPRQVVAVATISGCHKATIVEGLFKQCCKDEWGDRLYRPFVPAFHITLADVVALPEPVGPVRGQLQVPWRLPEDVADRVFAQFTGVSGV